jgi:nucleoside-diphosphate-sugar epimerase
MILKLENLHIRFATAHVELGRRLPFVGNADLLLNLCWLQTWSNEEKDVSTNLDVVETILTSVKESPIRRIVFASSCSVYGSLAQGRITEENATHFSDAYGKYKVLAEKAFTDFCSERDISYAILRYSSVYGPGETNGFISDVFNSALSNSEFIFNDMDSDFVYVDDVTDANLLALFGRGIGVFNIGYGRSIRRKTVAEKITTLCGIEKRFRISKSYNESYWVDISRASREFGYSPKIDIDTGLVKTFNWHTLIAKPPS